MSDPLGVPVPVSRGRCWTRRGRLASLRRTRASWGPGLLGLTLWMTVAPDTLTAQAVETTQAPAPSLEEPLQTGSEVDRPAALGATVSEIETAGPEASVTTPDAESSPPPEGDLLDVATPWPGDAELLESWVKANDAYDSGRYEEAIRGYLGLEAVGVSNGVLSYNLGNAYLRAGQLGRAIAAYRQARHQRPRDENARANLEFARQSRRDAIEPPEPSAAQRTLLFWHYGLSRSESWTALGLVSVLFWGLLSWSLFAGRTSELLRWSWGVLFVLFVALAASAASRALLTPLVGVVVPQEIDARVAPRSDSVVRFKLHAGTEVSVRQQTDGWIRIRLPDEQQGWVEAAHLALGP